MMHSTMKEQTNRAAPRCRVPLTATCGPWQIVSTLLLVLLAGCGGDGNEAPEDTGASAAPTAPKSGPPAGFQRATSSRETFDFTIVPDGGEIPLNEPFSLTVELFDHDTGKPLTDYDLATIDARMPAHGHGMKHDVELARQPDGTFRAEGLLFHMIGHWEIHLDVTRGPKIERAQTSVNLKF